MDKLLPKPAPNHSVFLSVDVGVSSVGDSNTKKQQIIFFLNM